MIRNNTNNKSASECLKVNIITNVANLTEILQIPKIMVLMEYYFPKQENV